MTKVPAAILDLMNMVISPYLDQFMIVFIDYILLYRCKAREQDLGTTLQTLYEQKLYPKFSKCELWQEIMTLLDHIVKKDVFQFIRQR